VDRPRPKRRNLRLRHLGVAAAMFALWHLLTTPGLVPPFLFDNERRAAFFFGEPLKIFGEVWNWLVVAADICRHLAVMLATVGRSPQGGSALRHRTSATGLAPVVAPSAPGKTAFVANLPSAGRSV
jgi:hypothetical protein